MYAITSNNINRKSLMLCCRYFCDWQQHVQIPPRIERSPTDVLRALESTIRRDPTAAHFKYHDDPFLIPSSNIGKRLFALSQESGRKAAKWVKNQHPELFQHHEAEPVIPQFLGKNQIDKNTEMTEDLLKENIDERHVSEAIFIFNSMTEKGLDISDEQRIRFFELICFYNCEDTIPDENIEERWFQQNDRSVDRLQKTWKNNDLAEKLFTSFEQKDSRIYTAIICGMVKYNEADRAWELFNTARQNNIHFPIDVYNKMLSIVHLLKETSELRLKVVTELLHWIENDKLVPNVQTLNEVLDNIRRMGINKFNKNLAMKVLNEFKIHLNIQPSLGTWSILINIFCRDKYPSQITLYDIMDQIEGTEFEIRDNRDINFFMTAMDVCNTSLNDLNLGHRIYNLLLFKNNYKMIGNSYKESIFYRHYFTLMMHNEPFHVLMNEIYDNLIPSVYVPESTVMEEILLNIELNNNYNYISKICKDLIAFDYFRIEKLLLKVLSIMIKCPQTEYLEEFGQFALQAWQRMSQRSNTKIDKNLELNGKIFGDIMILLLKSNKYQDACLIMKDLRFNKYIVNLPDVQALDMFIEHSIINKQPTQAIKCIAYCHENGFSNAEEWKSKVIEQMTLDKEYLAKLELIFTK